MPYKYNSFYGISIFESMETDLKHKNDAQSALRNGDLDAAKSAANNISDKAKKSTIKNEIKRKQEANKPAENE